MGQFTACSDADPCPAGGDEDAQDILTSLRLHESHALVLEVRTSLANCCNAARDFVSAARHLGALARAMQAVFPPPPAYHHPEVSGVLGAWGDALRSALISDGGGRSSLPRRLAEGFRADMKQALEQCYQIRLVAMGDKHALTEEAEVQKNRYATAVV